MTYNEPSASSRAQKYIMCNNQSNRTKYNSI